MNKRDGIYNEADMALLSTVCCLTASAMENIQARESLLDYRSQLENFNSARDRVIHQFSHALKTPLAVLIASLKLLRRHLNRSTGEAWLPVYDRAQRNLARLLSIEYDMEDILGQRQDSTPTIETVPGPKAVRANVDLE
jgi:K+-sensing histidine kinase KdpD